MLLHGLSVWPLFSIWSLSAGRSQVWPPATPGQSSIVPFSALTLHYLDICYYFLLLLQHFPWFFSNPLALPDIKSILCPHLHGSLCCSKAKNYESLCLMSPLLCYYHTYSLQKPTENHPLFEKDIKINIVSLGLQTAYLLKVLYRTDRIGVFFF